MLIIPTVHLVYAPVVALAAVFAHVTHKKGPSSGRGVGSLDVARLAFAVAALIVRVASVVCFPRGDGVAAAFGGGGARAAWLARGVAAVGACALCGLLGFDEARRGLREATWTRLAWLAVASSAIWEAVVFHKTPTAARYVAVAYAAAAFGAFALYALVNAGARRGAPRGKLATTDYALLEESDGEEDVESPEDAAGFLSAVSFAWMSPLLATGYERPLESDDLFPLTRDDDPARVAGKLRGEIAKRGGTEPGKKVPLLGALCGAFGPYFLGGGVFKLVYDTTQLAVPVLLSRLLKALADDHVLAYKLAAALTVNAVVATAFLHQYFQRTYRTGMRLKSAAISLVFDKALVARTAGAEDEGALVTNLMSVDAQRLQDNMTYMFTIVSGVYQIVATLYLLYGQLGPASFGGLAVMLIFMPVTQRIVLVTRDYQKVVLEYKDRRIKLQSEALSGMKIVKLYGWEPPLGEELDRLRELELAALWKYKLAGIVSRCVFSVVPTVVAVATFALYVLTGNELDVARVYTTLALFNVLRFPLMMVPRAIGSAVEAGLSVERLGAFLGAPEVVPLPPVDGASNPLRESSAAVWARGADVDWPGAAATPLLRGVDLEVPRGALCAVVGETGSGKSGLLASLLGETVCARGSLGVEGSVAYAAQSAWIQNATLRANVLFGQPMDRARYDETIRRCSLTADLAALADGDLTEIGEKGLTLSGGQKQRVALARAFYADADVYLLDDCLSAVDAHVAAALFDDLVLHLRDELRRTVVLVTHNLSTLRKCDAVVCLGAGSRTVDYAGPPDGFLDLGRADPERYPLAAIAARQKRSTSGEHLSALAGDEAEAKEQDKAATMDAEKKPPRATAAEQREKGTISAATRRTYLMATGGSAMALLVVCAQVVYQASQVVGSWWLGYWAARPQLGSALGLEVYVGLSAVAVALSVVAYYVASLLGQRAARKLHASLLTGLLKAPMAFFDGTPTGRLVNLFSKDLYTIDEELPVTIAMWLMVATSCVATMATIAFATPWFLAVCLPLGVVYFGTMKYFIPSVRELKRLDATSRSPVFVAFGEALDGASTIRAFRAEKRFAADQGAKLRKNLRAYFLGTACNRWLAVRLEAIGTLTTGAAAFLAVATDAKPYLAGLSLTYALSVTQSLNWFVRTNADLENNSVAVERVVNCADTPPESDGHAGPPDGWPSKGDVTVTNLQLRYRPELPLVLKGLNFAVDGGTKLALVGRTGSGKSSFLLALLRLAPPAPGSKLVLDGVDVLSVKLADLRTRVSMIPQDPVLFSGTVRFNVDPFAAAADGDVRDALRDARLDDKLAGDDPLGAPVEEGGRNFSLGERQLLCLARACLRKSKLLLLDEATSAVDEALDEAVQLAIRANFKHSTVICIAHRINTIADYDRVLVLDDGNVVEDGAPAALMADPASKFAQLAAAHDEGV